MLTWKQFLILREDGQENNEWLFGKAKPKPLAKRPEEDPRFLSLARKYGPTYAAHFIKSGAAMTPGTEDTWHRRPQSRQSGK